MTEETNNCNIGTWGTLVGVVGGAALGYWAGRSSAPNGFCANGNMVAPIGYAPFGYGGFSNCTDHTANGNTAFAAGEAKAEAQAGLTYISGGIGAIRNDIAGVSAQINSGFQNIMDREYQKLIADNQSLKNELYTTNALMPVNAQLANIGCAVSCLKQNQVSAFRAVPLCTTCPSASTTTPAA